MNFKNKKVLITGGNKGIGWGLAKRFLAAGSKVLVTGRDTVALKKVKAEFPKIKTYKNDISSPKERIRLSKYVQKTFSDIDVLINNAGIQRRVPLAEDAAEWEVRQNEIDILFAAPVHLNHLLIPLLLRGNKESLIVNVTSGGAFIPQPFAPVYSACKAAMHSYTMNVRYALSETNCRVVELAPPAVQTDLGGAGIHHFGAQLDEFCDKVFAELSDNNKTEIGFGHTDGLYFQIKGKPQQRVFDASATQIAVKIYKAENE